MLVELRPGLLSNKGGTLMLLATLDRLRGRSFAVEPWIAPYDARARLGLYQKPWFNAAGAFAGVAAILPSRLRRQLGIVTEREIEAVVDLSGFALSDQFGPAKAERTARNVGRWKRAGKTVVLLPQAFGPFEDARVARAAQSVLEQADLVFARDPESFAHVTRLVGRRPSIDEAPDFTFAVPPIPPADADAWPPTITIVPNRKMLTHGRAAVASRYVEMLQRSAELAGERGFRVLAVAHETDDARLVDEVAGRLGGSVTVAAEPDPRRLKGILAASRVVVASRFHALVGALAEGVPAIASGWSHKYAALMRDFGCPELLIDPATADDSVLSGALDRCLEPTSRTELVRSLTAARTEMAAATERMWTKVEAVLGPAGS